MLALYRILIVEDDKSISQRLANHLIKNGFEAIVADQYEAIDEVFRQTAPHVVLLDVNLPRFDGYYWCKRIRRISNCPIIFISARDGEMDQVLAIEQGADDFITKPFYYDVVLAKIRSQIRRCYGDLAGSPLESEREIHFHGLTFYPERPEVLFRGQRVSLMKKEAELLGLLISKYPRSVTRDQILERLWDETHFVSENTLNVNVARLRRKLDSFPRPYPTAISGLAIPASRLPQGLHKSAHSYQPPGASRQRPSSDSSTAHPPSLPSLSTPRGSPSPSLLPTAADCLTHGATPRCSSSRTRARPHCAPPSHRHVGFCCFKV